MSCWVEFRSARLSYVSLSYVKVLLWFCFYMEKIMETVKILLNGLFVGEMAFNLFCIVGAWLFMKIMTKKD